MTYLSSLEVWSDRRLIFASFWAHLPITIYCLLITIATAVLKLTYYTLYSISHVKVSTQCWVDACVLLYHRPWYTVSTTESSICLSFCLWCGRALQAWTTHSIQHMHPQRVAWLDCRRRHVDRNQANWSVHFVAVIGRMWWVLLNQPYFRPWVSG